jgi:hypothetical protein
LTTNPPLCVASLLNLKLLHAPADDGGKEDKNEEASF